MKETQRGTYVTEFLTNILVLRTTYHLARFHPRELQIMSFSTKLSGILWPSAETKQNASQSNEDETPTMHCRKPQYKNYKRIYKSEFQEKKIQLISTYTTPPIKLQMWFFQHPDDEQNLYKNKWNYPHIVKKRIQCFARKFTTAQEKES